MLEFKLFESLSPEEDWDNRLQKFSDCNYRQTYAFLGLGSKSKNNVFRALLVNGNQTLVMAQGSIERPLPGVRALYFRDGPVYQATSDEKANRKNIQTFLRHIIDENEKRNRIFYLNLTMGERRTPLAEMALREVGMKRPFFERAPYLTYKVEIGSDRGRNLDAFDSKWRNQLKRAQNLRPTFIWGSDDALLKSYVDLHNDMCSLKSMKRYRLTYEEMRRLKQTLGAKLWFLIGEHQGKDVCGCAAIVFHNKAFYAYAAANQQGRDGYLSNAMVSTLIDRLRDEGVTELDLTGVDPQKNWGGYHFKKGIGGELFAYLGEWDYSRSNLAKLAANAILTWRSNGLYR